MTIALGILATDGVVIATDTQIGVQDYLKTHQGKLVVAHFGPSDNKSAAIAITGAGSVGYLARIKQDLLNAFYNSTISTTVDLHAYLDQYIHNFYKTHVIPFAEYHAAERPEVALLLGAEYDGDFRLLATEKNVCRRSLQYDAVGAGAMYAQILLGRLYTPVNLTAAAILAAYVVFHVKASIDGCGKDTHVCCISENHYSYFSWEQLTSLEKLFAECSWFENCAMQYIFDAKLNLRDMSNFLRRLRRQRAKVGPLVKD